MQCPSLRFPTRWTVLFVAVCSSVFTRAETNSVDELKTVRANFSQSLEYADQAAKEQFAWERRKEEMKNLTLLAEEEKRNLEAIVSVSRPLLRELQERKSELSVDAAESARLTDFLRVAAPALAETVIGKAQAWPEPLRLELRDSLAAIQAITESDRKTLSMKELETLVQSTLAAIEGALEFQNKVHRSSILKALPDGREGLFEVVFLGLGGGYYFSEELGLAGRIIPGEGEWRWEPEPQFLEAIRVFIEISEESRLATWVRLPVGTTTEGAVR